MKKLYAWVVQLPDGRESIVGIMQGGRFHMPCVVLDEELAHKLKPFAMAHSMAMKMPVELREYTLGNVVDKYEPPKAGEA